MKFESPQCCESFHYFSSVRLQLHTGDDVKSNTICKTGGWWINCTNGKPFKPFITASLWTQYRTRSRQSYLYHIFPEHRPFPTLLLQCTVKTYIKRGANKRNYGRLVGKGTGEKETGSLALVWTLWFLHTYALRLEVAAGMPLALSLLWESLRCIAHKACLIAAIFFFADNKMCYCLQPGFVAYRRVPLSPSWSVSFQFLYAYVYIFY